MIKVNNLEFSYGDGFNLKIDEMKINDGEFISIIGPNGSGKSTFIKLLSGTLNGYKGEIKVQDKELKSYSHKHISQMISVVPQEFSTLFEYSVESIVSTGRLPYEKPFSFFEEMTDDIIIHEAMKVTNVYNYKDEIFKNLSGGEKQRVMVSRAIAQDTKILLLDEFVSHLDPGYTQQLSKLVKSFSKEKKQTVISVFHDINLAAMYSDRIYVFDKGRIFCVGNPEEVINTRTIKDVYHLDAHILKHPVLNVPQIIYD